MDESFDAGGKVSSGLIATTIVSHWTWAASLLQSTAVTAKVINFTNGHWSSSRELTPSSEFQVFDDAIFGTN